MGKYNKFIKTGIFTAILFFSFGFTLSYFLFVKKREKVERGNLSMDINKTNNEPIHSIIELENAILNEGRKDYYEELHISYLDKELYEFLPWALVMANKFDHDVAYFDVYFSLFQLSNLSRDSASIVDWSLNELDNKTQEMAIEYLKKASKKGHKQANDILGHYYIEGKYVPQDTLLGKQLIKEGCYPDSN